MDFGHAAGVVGGPLVSGGLNLLGGLLQQGGQEASAQRQMDFQERMRDTTYQSAVAGMEEAGLNPALMYGSGAAAQAPSGTSFTPPNLLGGIASSAGEIVRLEQDLKESDARIRATNAGAAVSAATAQKMGLEIPELEVKKFFYEQGSRLLPMIRKWIDSTVSNAKEESQEQPGFFSPDRYKEWYNKPGLGLGVPWK